MSAQDTYGSTNCGFGGTRVRWTPLELAAMVLGFMLFWPLGLAALAYKYWRSKMGGPDLQTVATGAYERARSAMRGFPQNNAANWARGFTASTGNAAFDDWKRAELDRLEAERRKLEEAHKEFSDWLETMHKARDREEFDRFMNERRART